MALSYGPRVAPFIEMDRGTLADAARSAAYYDGLASRYDTEITSAPKDVLARRAFTDLVTRYVAPGSTILDFGCGTGIDAERYNRHGCTVLAYDNSPGMMTELTKRCADAITSGRIVPRCESYQSFGDLLAGWPAPHAVVANFAVLNMIRDLDPLFHAFARHLAPPGLVIVSLLNPWHWQLITRTWWRQAVYRKPDEPPLHLTKHFNSYLHFMPAVLRAGPAFRLVGRANAGTFVRYSANDGSTRPLWWEADPPSSRHLKRLLWQTPVRALVGPFMFVVLRRDA